MLLKNVHLHTIHFTDPEFAAFVRLLTDAAQVYALVGNASGLAFSQAIATALHVAGGSTQQQAELAKVISLNIEQKRLARERAELN